MSKEYRLLIMALLCGAANTNAQSFKNGGFEPMKPTKACEYVYNNQFSYTMGNTIYAFGNTAIGGNVGKIYLENDSCADNKAKDGSYFVALSSNDQQADAVAMALTSPLIANKNYTVQFYNKKGSLLVPIGLEVGYSNDTASFGTSIGTCPVPTDTNWTKQSFTFKPTSNAGYITLRGIKTTVIGYSMTPVDAFSLQFAAGIAETGKELTAVPYPNPFTEKTRIQLSEQTQFPCSIRITDLTGKTIFEKKDIEDREVEIERNGLPTGTYLLEVKDDMHRMYCTRLIAI